MSLARQIRLARIRLGLTQGELAERSGLSQSSVSRIEAGKRSPWLGEAVALARALDRPLQWFLTGEVRPGTDLVNLAVELRSLGAVDIIVPEARVPGAFRRTEETLVSAASGERPDPRVIETVPALLAWNHWQPRLLEAFAQEGDARAAGRLAWLADVALAVDRAEGFPGGLASGDALLEFIDLVKRPDEPDDLGYPAEKENPHRIWKYWRITCSLDYEAFRARAFQLHRLREPARTSE